MKYRTLKEDIPTDEMEALKQTNKQTTKDGNRIKTMRNISWFTYTYKTFSVFEKYIGIKEKEGKSVLVPGG